MSSDVSFQLDKYLALLADQNATPPREFTQTDYDSIFDAIQALSVSNSTIYFISMGVTAGDGDPIVRANAFDATYNITIEHYIMAQVDMEDRYPQLANYPSWPNLFAQYGSNGSYFLRPAVYQLQKNKELTYVTPQVGCYIPEIKGWMQLYDAITFLQPDRSDPSSEPPIIGVFGYN